MNAFLASVSSYALIAAGAGDGGTGNLPVDVAHRYWRLNIRSWNSNASYEGLSGLQLYQGSVNVAPGGTLTADKTVQAGSLAEVLNYGPNTLLQFAIGQAESALLTIDFGANNGKRIDSVGIYPNKDSENRSPKSFYLEFSDDGIAWTKKAFMRLLIDELYTVGVEKKFDVPAVKAKGSHWAIFGWQPSGSIGELEFVSQTGQELTTGQTAFASSNYSSGENAAKAIDNDNNTNWSGGGEEYNGSTLLGVQFDTEVQPVKVSIQSRNDGTYWNQTPWQNVFFGYGDDRKTFRIKEELTKANTSNPYNGPVQKVTYDAPLWIAGPGPNAHRYWRVKGMSVGAGDNAQYSEIEFRDSVGGLNLAVNGTPIASSEFSLPTWAKENAFDGNPSTNWAAQGVIGQWIGYDFGKKVEIGEVAMRASSAADQFWGTMNLEYSDDGVVWTLRGVLLTSPKVDSWRYYVPFIIGEPDAGWDLAHRYWRMETLQFSGYQGMSELIFLDGETDLVTMGGTPSVDAAQGGYPVTNLFDRNVSTGWADNANGVPHQIQWDFGAGNGQKVTSYKVGGWPSGGITPTGWRIQFSDDGTTWKTADMRLGESAFASSEVRSYVTGPKAPPPLMMNTDPGRVTPIVSAWGLRRLISTYTGPLVRIRQGNDNVEKDLYADEVGWLAPFTSNGTPYVTRVYNQSSVASGDDLVQTIENAQPILQPNGMQSGKAAIKFSGVFDFLKGETNGKTRPYMVEFPSMYFLGQGDGVRKDYTTIAKVVNQAGQNSSPYARYGFNCSEGGTQESRAFEVRYGADSTNIVGRACTTHRGVMGIFLGSWRAYDLAEVDGVVTDTHQTISHGANDYPNDTAMYVAANGGAGENWGGKFSEMVIFSGEYPTEADHNKHANYLLRAAVRPGYGEGGLARIRNLTSYSNVNGYGFAEVEVRNNPGGADMTLPAVAGATAFYSTGEAAFYATDDNPSSIWSSGQDKLNSKLYMAKLPGIPAEVSVIFRNDQYWQETAKTFELEWATHGGWVSSGILDNGVGSQGKLSVLTFGDGDGSEDPDPTWTSIFAATDSGTSNSWGEYTARGRVATSTFATRAFRYIRLKLKSSAGGLVIDKAALGVGTGADFSMVAAPVPVTFNGGSASITVPANTEFYTDPIDMNGIDYASSGRRLQLSAYMTNTDTTKGFAVASDNQRAITGAGTGDRVTQTATTGFSDISGQRSIILGVEGIDTVPA